MNRDKKGAAITSRAPEETAPRSSNSDSAGHRSLKDIAESKLKSGNATQLGDPISLKAETSDSSPTDDDRGAAGDKREEGVASGQQMERKSLKEVAESNPTMLGDPVSLKAETADSEPTEEDRGAMSKEDRKKVGSKL